MNSQNVMTKHDEKICNDVVDIKCKVCGEITYRKDDTCMPCQIEVNRIKNFIKRLGKRAIIILIDEVINWTRINDKERIMNITITPHELMEKGKWDEVCEMKGYSLYCVNEGTMPTDEPITLTQEQAKVLGLI